MTNRKTLIEALRRTPEEEWGLTTEPHKLNPKTILLPPGSVHSFSAIKAFEGLQELLPRWTAINDSPSVEFPQKTSKFRVLAALAK